MTIEDSAGQQAGHSWLRSRWATVVQRGLLGILIAYCGFLYFWTHIPVVPQGLAEQNDKLLHLGAYGVLGSLLLTWRISCGPVSIRSVGLLLALVIAFAVFDELTQIPVGRDCELEDGTADTIGTILAFAVTWPVASRIFRA